MTGATTLDELVRLRVVAALHRYAGSMSYEGVSIATVADRAGVGEDDAAQALAFLRLAGMARTALRRDDDKTSPLRYLPT